MPTIAPQAAQGTVIATGSLIAPGGQSGLQGNTGAMGDGMPVGMVYAYTSVTPPLGSMLCDGSAISRSAYPALFTVFGTQFGSGDGVTTFNLPDLRSRFILGQGQGSGLSNRVIAATGGEENHVLSLGEIPTHTHGLGNHTHLGANHLHDLQNHYHYCAGVNHLHGLGNHVHGIGSPINHAAVAPGTGAGSYDYLFSPANGSAWISGTTGGPNTASDGADRSLAFNSAGPTPNNSGWSDRDLTTAGPSTNTSDAAGSGSGHNNMPPWICLVYMIKVAAGGGPTAQAPIANQTQAGLMNIISGKMTDYVGGDNACHPLPVVNASTTTTATFTMPALGATVSNVQVNDTSWMNVGMVLNVGKGTSMQLMTVTSVGSPVTVTLYNYAGPTVSGTIAVGTSIWYNASALAGTNIPGIINGLSGNIADVICGDNACRSISSLVAITSLSLQGGWPKSGTITVPFKADLLVNASVSFFCTTGGVINVQIQLDGVAGFYPGYYFNEPNSHKQTSGSGIWRAVAAGSHTLGIAANSGAMSSDTNDYATFGVTMVRVT